MTAIIVNVHDAKTRLSQLLDQVHAGQEIILVKAGKPCARLVPLDPSPTGWRKPGRLQGRIGTDEAFFCPLSASELAAWEDR